MSQKNNDEVEYFFQNTIYDDHEIDHSKQTIGIEFKFLQRCKKRP